MSINKLDSIIADSLHSTIEESARVIADNYALDTMRKNGSVSMEEANTMYAMAHTILMEGSEDFIPENLDIPDIDASTDANMGGAGADADAAPDMDPNTMDSMADMDLDVSDLEGIILADTEGNEYIVQGGILSPYTDASVAAGTAAAEDVSEDEDDNKDEAKAQNAANDKQIEESSQSTEEAGVITESTVNMSTVSDVVQSLISDLNFNAKR